MDVEPVDRCCEVVERVDLPLLLAPVEFVGPIRHQFPLVGEVRAVVPTGVLDFVGKTCAA